MNITNHHELPCEISLSFDLLFHYYQNQLLEEENELVIQHIKALLDSFKKYPFWGDNLYFSIFSKQFTKKNRRELLKRPTREKYLSEFFLSR